MGRPPIDPQLPFIQIHRSVGNLAAQLSGMLGIELPAFALIQYVRGSLDAYWENLADRGLLRKALELKRPRIVLSPEDVKLRLMVAFKREVDPKVFVPLRVLEPDAEPALGIDSGYRSRGFSRYLNTEYNRLWQKGCRDNPKRRRAAGETCTPLLLCVRCTEAHLNRYHKPEHAEDYEDDYEDDEEPEPPPEKSTKGRPGVKRQVDRQSTGSTPQVYRRSTGSTPKVDRSPAKAIGERREVRASLEASTNRSAQAGSAVSGKPDQEFPAPPPPPPVPDRAGALRLVAEDGEEGGEKSFRQTFDDPDAEPEEALLNVVEFEDLWLYARLEHGLQAEQATEANRRKLEPLLSQYTPTQWIGCMDAFLDLKRSRGAAWVEDKYPLAVMLSPTVLPKKMPDREPRKRFCCVCKGAGMAVEADSNDAPRALCASHYGYLGQGTWWDAARHGEAFDDWLAARLEADAAWKARG